VAFGSESCPRYIEEILAGCHNPEIQGRRVRGKAFKLEHLLETQTVADNGHIPVGLGLAAPLLVSGSLSRVS
jgi:hypothetical protein